MASVIAPVLSIAVSMTIGISTLLLAAVPLYLLAGFVEPAAPASPPAARDIELSPARRA